ncbi:MAG: hypothetical protein RLY78_2855 [Pseudomonadota bacterium]
MALFPRRTPSSPAAPRTDGPLPLGPEDDADLHRVWDALCFLQHAAYVAKLSELLQAGSWRTQRGTAFNPQTVRDLLRQLEQRDLVRSDDQGRWHPQPALAWARFTALVLDDAAQRQRWWDAWRAHLRFEQTWHLEVLSDAALVGVLRVVLLAGGRWQDAERLEQVLRRPVVDDPVLLSHALLHPFEPALIERIDPELRLRLLLRLTGLPMGDTSPVTAPLWAWLSRCALRDGPHSLHDPLRHALALHALLCGSADVVPVLLDGLDDGEATALRAGAAIVQGRWADGALAFEAALKQRATELGRRKDLLPDALLWLHALAQLARQEPAQWTATRKWLVATSGKRQADRHTLWGLWHLAYDQRLGDAPREASAFSLEPPPAGAVMRLHALMQLSHLLLAAWLGHTPARPEATRALAQALAADWQAIGLDWLAGLAMATCARLLGEPLPVDAPALPLPAPVERWREALQAIIALGGGAGATSTSSAPEAAPRLIWTLQTSPAGRILAIEAQEQKPGARGWGRPKPISLLALSRRQDLPPRDLAVLRAMRKQAWGGKLELDLLQAAPALIGHPHVVWDDAPETFVQVQEALPRLEVLTRDGQLQFQLLDAVHPDDALAREQAARRPARPAGTGTDNGPDDPAASLATALADARARYPDLAPDEQLGLAHALLEVRAERRALREAATGRAPAPSAVTADGGIAPALTADAWAVRLLRDAPDQARLLRINAAQLRVAELVRQGWQVPAAARDEITAALRVLAGHFQLASDADAGQQVPASAVLRASLSPQADGLRLTLRALPFGDFGPRLSPGRGRPRVTTVHQGATLSTERLLDAEAAARDRLLQACPWLDDGADDDWPLDDPEQALATVQALASLAPEVIADWPQGRPMTVRDARADQLRLTLGRPRGHGAAQDWLSLDGELALDGAEVLKLERLLALVAGQRSRYLPLGDGQFLALTEQLRQQLADLQALAQSGGRGAAAGSLRIAPAAALAWAAQPGAPGLAGDTAWRERLAAWDAAAQWQQAEPPHGLQAELRDYQRAGWRWLMRLSAAGFGAVLADDMGLGKTLQTLGVLLARASAGPALVVAPTSVCGNWLAEARRFAPGLRVAVYGLHDEAGDESTAVETETDTEADAGPAAAPPAAEEPARRAGRRAQLQSLGAGDLLICSYGLLQRDAELLHGLHWHTVVLDEAQAIKNAVTARARAAQGLMAHARIALSGTPIENRLSELWSIMACVNPGLLGPLEVFNQRFAGPIERDGDATAGRRLRRLISPFLLRRTKAEVLDDLPPRTEIVQRIVPGARERALHEALRREAEADLQALIDGGPAPAAAAGRRARGAAAPTTPTAGASAGQAQMHILAALTRLRRAACDPRLVLPEAGLIGAKVQAFEQLARELSAGRHKTLVFSQFTDFLALLRERLEAAGLGYQYLDGSTPAAQRSERVAAFQGGEGGDFFLISLKAGGFGLNLTIADYVVIADPWWNPAAEDQASGRAHRIGQTRPVTVYRLVTQGTVEDRIVALHQHKRGLAESVLDGQDGGGALAADDLLALLRDTPEVEGPAT